MACKGGRFDRLRVESDEASTVRATWANKASGITNRFVALKVGDSSDVYPSEVPEAAAAVNMTQKTKASKG